jgi:hypothetical protein
MLFGQWLLLLLPLCLLMLLLPLLCLLLFLPLVGRLLSRRLSLLASWVWLPC